MQGLWDLGHEKEAIRVGERMMKIAGGRPGKAPELMYQDYDWLLWNLSDVYASNLAAMESHGGIGTMTLNSGAEGLLLAQNELQMHDLVTATPRVKTTPMEEKLAPDFASAAFAQALLAEEREDFPKAAKEWDAFAVVAPDPDAFAQYVYVFCYPGVRYQKSEQPQEAPLAIASWCSGDCWIRDQLYH